MLANAEQSKAISEHWAVAFLTFSCYRWRSFLRTPGKRSLFLRVLETRANDADW